MVKVLVVTGLLPVPYIEKKMYENDILLETEERLTDLGFPLSFKYIFTLPYSNSILGWFSKKWDSYSSLQRSKRIPNLRGRDVSVLGILLLPRKVFFRNYLYKISFYANRKIINQIVMDFMPDVIHAHNAENDAYLARMMSKKFKIPYIVTMRALKQDTLVADNLNQAWKRIAISPIQMRDSAKITNLPVTIIPHGVSKVFYENTKRHFTILYPERGPLKIISVCRLLKYKNIDAAIRSLAKLRDFNFEYEIYGDGPEFQYLDGLISLLNLRGKVILKGRVTYQELADIIPKFDVFLLVSNPETFGRVYLEAMASGLMVIATSGTGIDGIITHGKEGFLVDIQQSETNLVAVLERIFVNPEILMPMSIEAQKLSRNFEWTTIAENLYKTYSDGLDDIEGRNY